MATMINGLKYYMRHTLTRTVYMADIASRACLPACALSLAVLPIAVLPTSVQASTAQTYVIHTYGGANLLPAVRQQLDSSADGGTVSVYQDKLVLITTARNYQRVQQLLQQIDRQPQVLKVAVRVGNSGSLQGNIRQSQVIITNRGIQGTGSISQYNSQQQGSNVYQVQTLSGSAASINTSTLYALSQSHHANDYSPYYRSGNYHLRPQIVIQQQILLPTTQGISVTPSLLPNGQVEVQLSQVVEKLAISAPRDNETSSAPHTIQGQRLNSTIIVPRGKWVTIGQISQTSTSSGSNMTNSSNGVSSNSIPISLLIE